MKVRDLMTTEVLTLGVDDPMITAEELMGLRRIRHLPVVEDGKVVGLVTHRDLMRGALSPLVDQNRVDRMVHKASITVRQLMHHNVVTIGPDDDLADAAARMAASKYGCLPVVDDGTLLGIVTEADFLRLTEVVLRHVAAVEPDLLDTLKDRLSRAEPEPPPPWRRA